MRCSLFAILVSCGRTEPFADLIDTSDAKPTPDVEVLATSNATILNACGPTDGLAYRLRVVEGKAEITCPTIAISGAYDEIFWFAALPNGPGTYSLEPDDATGSHCTSSTSCTTAASLTVTLTEFAKNGSAVKGSYTLRFADGSARSKPFSAIKCNNFALCG